MISSNIQMLRRAKGLTQEALAHRVGVSRQTVAKWEAGESVPDLANGSALAEVLGVTLDTLASYKPTELGETPPPRGKHIFGSVRVGERGQMVIPKRAREVFGIEPGDELLLLGDEERGLALGSRLSGGPKSWGLARASVKVRGTYRESAAARQRLAIRGANA